MFGWTHITLLMVVAQSSVMIQNTYEGLAWFLLPSILVITNDIFAYIFGICFGRTKLIDLSPKKTWEGFVGGSASTLLAAFIIARELQKHQYLICPMQDIIFTPFESVHCEPSSYFVSRLYESAVGEFDFSEFQIHAMIISLFASLIAPFGGFFASGFKRAIKIKDFADMIPGHGGVTDRMDC
jgi:phosphatidate cytidylyltransferase